MAASHLCESVLSAVGSFYLRDNFLSIEAGHGVLVVANVALGRVKVLTASFSYDLEAVYLGLVVVNFGWQDNGLRVMLQEVMREGSSEERAIDVD